MNMLQGCLFKRKYKPQNFQFCYPFHVKFPYLS